MSGGNRYLIGDSLPIVGMLGAVSVLTVMVWQVTSAMSESRRVYGLQERIVASLVAEEAAQIAVDKFGAGTTLQNPLSVASEAGLVSRVEPLVNRNGTRLRIRVAGARNRTHLFQCQLLPGAAPAWLGERLTLTDAVLIDRPELLAWVNDDLGLTPARIQGGFDTAARLDPGALLATPDGNHEILTEDPSIGVLRLPAGTDRPDFVFGRHGLRVETPPVPTGGVMVVHGNLWVDQGPYPLVLNLASPLTIVVEGNIYLGRTVAVRGSGHLTLVARRGPTATFRDRDGDGAWSSGDTVLGIGERAYSGPVEGAGMVYLGLPGVRQRPVENFDLVASVLAEGELYVRARSAAVHGALCGGFGISRFDGARLSLTGSRLPSIQRAALPGFLRAGPLRPGVLEELK
jgi:hypothetical protein